MGLILASMSKRLLHLLSVPVLVILPWATWGQSALPNDVAFEAFYDQTQISFTQPTFVGGVPNHPDYLVVIERAGQVSLLAPNANSASPLTRYQKTPWFKVDADTTTHWDGAWTVEFHPQFPQKPLFYVLYRQKTGGRKSAIEEWKVDGIDLAHPTKVRTVIEFTQKSIHSSGDMKFGPDGLLYSSQGDRQQSGQDRDELWGKVIRIDVDHKDAGLEYAIPSDNPFKDVAGTRPEIYALGFRVPWRLSFDKLTGSLWLGDVGDVKNDEINLVRKGLNYGAGKVEGMCTSNCTGLTNPVQALSRTLATCVIGGFVYRNDPASPFYGAYLFGDYGTRKLYAARPNADTTAFAELQSIGKTMPGAVSALGMDGRGNFYAAMYRETGSTIQSHVFRLKHEDLKPLPTPSEIKARLLAHQRDLGSNKVTETDKITQFILYGLDGKRRSRITGLHILKDESTGKTQLWMPAFR